MDKIKYGILGCGKHALQSHAIPSRSSSLLELHAICDLSDERMAEFEKTLGLELSKHTNRDKFMRSGIEAVMICTPDEYHFQDLRAAIGHRLHAFTEKPLATTIDQVDALKDEFDRASKSGLVVSSCHPRRYDPPFQWMKDNLDELTHTFGKPMEFGFDFSYHKPTKDWKHTRGLLLDHANHELDLMHHLFGYDPFGAIKMADGPTMYHVIGSRDDGLTFKFSGTRSLETHEYLEWASIRFERGELTVDAHQGTATIKTPDSRIDLKIQPTDYEARGRATMENFAKAIRKEEACYLTHEDLYANTAMSVMLTENRIWEYKPTIVRI